VVAGVADTWGGRYDLNPDGISYIEMARHALAGQRDGLISGYWSPGLPALLVPLQALAGQDAVTAIPALHLVNFIAFLVAAALFLRLLRAVEPAAGSELSRYAVPLGAATIAAIAVRSIGLGLLTPDTMVMVVVIAAALITMRIEASPRPWRWAVALGAVLGAGYWTKGILLPLGAALLLLLLILPPAVARARTKIVVAAAVFAVVSLPLAVLVSRRVGHATFSDVGRLNYAWEINQVTPFAGWLGDSTPRFGAPVHPPRLLQAAPQTLEFATPLHGTYALWFDPSYWYAGVRPRFDAAGQWRVLRLGFHELSWTADGVAALLVSLLALWFFTAADPARTAPRSRLPLALAAWSAGAALLYAMVHVEPRYLAGFIAVAIASGWSLLAGRRPRRALPWAIAAATIAIGVSIGARIAESTGGYPPSFRPDYLVGADSLRAAGIRAGERVAMVGDPFEAYAAFAAGTPVTVQVVDSAAFWALDSAGRRTLQEQIAATGVTALLANNVAAPLAAEGWRLVPYPDSSNLGILRLPR
jgi:4-amino-4-deoxy-L-arabinose transferase-like glycosyltransferase